MYFDPETEEHDSELTDDAAELFEQIAGALLRARRMVSAIASPHGLNAYGVRSRTEAQVLGFIARELFCSNHDGARSCLVALYEDGFGPVQSVWGEP
jgi:hypothetical protein